MQCKNPGDARSRCGNPLRCAPTMQKHWRCDAAMPATQKPPVLGAPMILSRGDKRALFKRALRRSLPDCWATGLAGAARPPHALPSMPSCPPPCIRVKQVRFGKLAFLQQNGALFGPKKCDFRPFRATFSMKNVWSVLFRKPSIGTFGSVGYFLRFQHKN